MQMARLMRSLCFMCGLLFTSLTSFANDTAALGQQNVTLLKKKVTNIEDKSAEDPADAETLCKLEELYDRRGNLLSSVEYGCANNLMLTTKFEYDGSGQLVLQESFDLNGSLISKEVLTKQAQGITIRTRFNANNKLLNIRLEQADKRGRILRSWDSDLETGFDHTSIFEYKNEKLSKMTKFRIDSQNQKLKRVVEEVVIGDQTVRIKNAGESRTYKKTVTQAINNFKKEILEYNHKGLKRRNIETYNNKTQLLLRESFDQNGKLLAKSEYEYDALGHLVNHRRTNYADGTAEIEKFHYDQFGNETLIETYVDKKLIHLTKIVNEYYEQP